jgi:hypothetical protein
MHCHSWLLTTIDSSSMSFLFFDWNILKDVSKPRQAEHLSCYWKSPIQFLYIHWCFLRYCILIIPCFVICIVISPAGHGKCILRQRQRRWQPEFRATDWGCPCVVEGHQALVVRSASTRVILQTFSRGDGGGVDGSARKATAARNTTASYHEAPPPRPPHSVDHQTEQVIVEVVIVVIIDREWWWHYSFFSEC